ncbi:MAG: mechanosensitive ion channel family protein [Gemmatimonadaceae bacterium]
MSVSTSVSDSDIKQRLIEILSATGRFSALDVSVRGGVVFLQGFTTNEEDRRWAGDLARKTEGVAAVMNHIAVTKPSVWDFQPAVEEIRNLGRGIVRTTPFVVLAILVLAFTVLLAKLATRAARRVARNHTTSALLLDVTARGAGFVVILVGLYVVFRVMGLTTVALTVVGGTGVLGIILGIAFRDISENLLASVFLSVQHPFSNGDLVEIEGVTGYVQRLTMRATLLMTLDGNHVQIPNSTVYKGILRNFTSNPNRREDFTVGIGYDDPVPFAQQVALKVLAEHPALLKDPEPWVLVDSLGSTTVNLKIYFWLDGTRHSWLKVKSSVIRLVKRAFQDAGISMPDEARELIFPNGVPVTIREADNAQQDERKETDRPPTDLEAEDVATDAEAGLRSEAAEIEEQARTSRSPEQGDDLLSPGS